MGGSRFALALVGAFTIGLTYEYVYSLLEHSDPPPGYRTPSYELYTDSKRGVE